jgi:hypothetical protein
VLAPRNSQQQSGGASLSDLLTVAKNIVQAVNSLAQTYLNVQGAQNFAGLTAATVVKASGGRIAIISVIVAGSAAGAVYDSAAIGNTTKPLFVIPTTVGVTVVNLSASFGITVVPGTGQTVSGSFS